MNMVGKLSAVLLLSLWMGEAGAFKVIIQTHDGEKACVVRGANLFKYTPNQNPQYTLILRRNARVDCMRIFEDDFESGPFGGPNQVSPVRRLREPKVMDGAGILRPR